MAMRGRTESHAPPRIRLRNVDGIESATKLARGPAPSRDRLTIRTMSLVAVHPSQSNRLEDEGQKSRCRLLWQDRSTKASKAAASLTSV